MQRTLLVRIIAVVVLAIIVGGGRTVAQEHTSNTPTVRSDAAHPLSLSPASAYNVDLGFRDSELLLQHSGDSGNPNGRAKSHDYLEINEFFNVREANVDTVTGEWELEIESEWFTGQKGDDEFAFTPNLRYGLNDDMFVEVEILPLTIGDGGSQGNGDIAVLLFNQFTRETEAHPAFAAWIRSRLPTGEGSSGVDGELHVNLTRTVATDLRGHLEGFTKTANGGRGDHGDNRRALQWGAGIGVDYQIDAHTICMVNYLNRTSEEYGNANEQILEIGGVREVAQGEHLKMAVDIELHGNEETPDLGFKVLWSLAW